MWTFVRKRGSPIFQFNKNYWIPTFRRTFASSSNEKRSLSHASVPKECEIVVIGGGIIGCSVAYHLAKAGKQVLLLERSGLTHGSTWHAAGLVGQLRNSYNMTRMLQYSTELYRNLSRDTDYSLDWKEVGSLRLASSPERWLEIQKSYSIARGFGFEMDLISPQEAKRLCPILNIEGVYGAAWIPSDGYVDPTSLTMALAKGARKYQATIIEGIEVTGFIKKEYKREQRITHVIHSAGETKVDSVVNCAGIFARDVGKLMGTAIPTINVQHQYMVSDPIPSLPAEIPTFRDPDYMVYYKPEVSGLVMGGWEPNTIPVNLPKDFGPELFSPNFDRFEQHVRGAAVRTPVLNEVGVKSLINGPIPMSPDGEPILGRTVEVGNAYVAAGFTAGVAGSGGAGKMISEWIINGEPSLNLWPLDIRRFGQPHQSRAFLEARAVEAYGDYYTLKFPFRELSSCREMRKSPIYDILKQKGAVFGSKFGFERPNWFVRNPENSEDKPTFGIPNWWKEVGEEHTACREAVALIDLSSFAKMEISGQDAPKLVRRLSANSINNNNNNNNNKHHNQVVYTQFCNDQGGIECDLTVAQLSSDRFYVVTGSGFGTHDFGWIKSRVKEEETELHFSDVSGSLAVINLCGPYARKVLEKVVDPEDDVSNEGFPFMTWKNITVGMAPVRALRVTFIGELGWELHIRADYAQHVYSVLWSAGLPFGIRDVGYRAISSLRCEKGYRFWGSDVSPDTNPIEAGLGFCVDWDDHEHHFIGREALEKIKEQGVSRKFVCFTLDDSPYPLDGNELIYFNDKVVGLSTSAGYGYTVGKHIAFGYVPVEISTKQGFTIEVYGKKIPAKRHPINKSLYDPDRTKILS